MAGDVRSAPKKRNAETFDDHRSWKYKNSSFFRSKISFFSIFPMRHPSRHTQPSWQYDLFGSCGGQVRFVKCALKSSHRHLLKFVRGSFRRRTKTRRTRRTRASPTRPTSQTTTELRLRRTAPERQRQHLHLDKAYKRRAMFLACFSSPCFSSLNPSIA